MCSVTLVKSLTQASPTWITWSQIPAFPNPNFATSDVMTSNKLLHFFVYSSIKW